MHQLATCSLATRGNLALLVIAVAAPLAPANALSLRFATLAPPGTSPHASTLKHPLPTATGRQAGDLPEWARLVWRYVADDEEGSSAGGQHAAAQSATQPSVFGADYVALVGVLK